jgi:hypothetical protein
MSAKRWGGEINETITPGVPFLKKGQIVLVCKFRIVEDFVIFGLYRNDDNTLGFANAVIDDSNQLIIEGMPISEINNHYVGYTKINETFVFWYESNVDLPIKMHLQDRWWWVLSSEIVNWGRTHHLPIDLNVAEHFLEHKMLLIVFDMNAGPMRCPVVGYVTGNPIRHITVGPSRGEDLLYRFNLYDVKKGMGVARFSIRLGEQQTVREHFDINTYDTYFTTDHYATKMFDQHIPLSYIIIV